MNDHNERPAIWIAIQEEQYNLATRCEKRTALDWINAVVNRVMSKHNLLDGNRQDTLEWWTEAMILETWLAMSLQEQAKLEAAGKRMAAMLAAVMPHNVDNPPGPGEVPPQGTKEAMILQEGLQTDGTVIAREAVEMTRSGMAPGMSYSEGGVEAGVLSRVWTVEIDGKLAIMVWMEPKEMAPPTGASIM